MGISGKFALKGAGCVAKTSFAGFTEGDGFAVGVVSRGVTDGDGFAVGEGVILGVGEYVEELVGDGESLGDRLGEALAETEGTQDGEASETAGLSVAQEESSKSIAEIVIRAQNLFIELFVVKTPFNNSVK